MKLFIIGKQQSKIKQHKIPRFQTCCAFVDPPSKIIKDCQNIEKPVGFSLIKHQSTTISHRETGIFYYQNFLKI